MWTKSELEIKADQLLAKELKNKKRNKNRKEEYPILSDSQLARRRAMEIPLSSLSQKQKANAEDNENPD